LKSEHKKENPFLYIVIDILELCLLDESLKNHVQTTVYLVFKFHYLYFIYFNLDPAQKCS